MPNELMDLLLQRAVKPPTPPNHPIQGMMDTGLYGPAIWDREAQPSALPPNVAELMGTGKNDEAVAALRELFQDPRYRASHGLVGSGVPLEDPMSSQSAPQPTKKR